jgi:hypothetical protein
MQAGGFPLPACVREWGCVCVCVFVWHCSQLRDTHTHIHKQEHAVRTWHSTQAHAHTGIAAMHTTARNQRQHGTACGHAAAGSAGWRLACARAYGKHTPKPQRGAAWTAQAPFKHLTPCPPSTHPTLPHPTLDNPAGCITITPHPPGGNTCPSAGGLSHTRARAPDTSAPPSTRCGWLRCSPPSHSCCRCCAASRLHCGQAR